MISQKEDRMNETTNSFMVESQEIKFQKNIEFSKLKGSIFRHYGHDDPAGLCDGGDYLYNIQIRVENAQGDVYISIKPIERSVWWSAIMSWEEFHNMLLESFKKHPKVRYHEH